MGVCPRDVTQQRQGIKQQLDQLKGERGRIRLVNQAKFRTILLSHCKGIKVDANGGSRNNGGA